MSNPRTMANDPVTFVNAFELLAYLRSLDVEIGVKGEHLALSAPKHILTSQLQKELRLHKAEILNILLDKRDQTSAITSRTSVCVHEMVEAQAVRSPDATAVICGTERLSYHELSRRSTLLAGQLRTMGVQSESIVGVYLDRSVNMVVALLAVHKAGAAYLPLDPEFPAERLAFMLEDSAAAVIVTRQHLRSSLLPGSAAVLCLDGEPTVIKPEQSLFSPGSSRPDCLAYVIYTSGSTGRPKGVAVEHCSMVNLLKSMQRVPGISAQDNLLSVTTLSFDIAGLEIFLPLITGARLTIAPRTAIVDGAALADLLRTTDATMMQATPVTWHLLLDAGWDGQPRLKMLCGGEALTRELANRLLATGGELWNLYGPTETTIWSTVHRVEHGKGPVPIGRPVAETQVYILDEQQRPVPPGVAGELYIGGRGVARGYLNRPEETFARFIADPFQTGKLLYRTGDLVRQRIEGYLEYVGRNDQQVKLRGFRIELGEVEAALEQQAGVRQAVVSLREDDPGDPRLVAYVVSATPGDSATLQSAVSAQLPRYMVPSAFVFLDALPLTPNKKVDRKALPAPDASPAIPSAVPHPNSSRLESSLIEIWRALLKVPSVDPHDNFFALGGHSLLIVQLQNAIRRQLGREVSIPDLFQYPAVSELAQFLESPDVSRAGLYSNSLRPKNESPTSPGGDEPSRNTPPPLEYLDGGDANTDAEALFTDATSHPSSYAPENCLVLAQPRGTQRPLFMVAGFQGPDDTLLVLSRIVPYLGRNQPVYGFRPRWVLGGPLYTSVAEEAHEYLAALRQVQPHGPYLLTGYCLSGLIALDMARQLLQAGEEVDLLALIDTELPSTARTLFANTWNTWERLRHIGSVIRDLLRRDDTSRSSAAWEVIRRKMNLNAAARITPHEAFYRTKLEYQRTIRKYVPPNYSGRLTLIANEELYNSPDPYRGWRGFHANEMVIHKVSGDHISIFKEHGRELAELLLECANLTPRKQTSQTEFVTAEAL